MRFNNIFIVGTMLALSMPAIGLSADTKPIAPDNSGINVRDAQGNTATPENQSETSADRDLTQKVRQAVTADDALSINAKNVKIITVGGRVTLRGPVNSQQERTSIALKAEQIAGAGKVINELEVIPEKTTSKAKTVPQTGTGY